MYVTVPWLRRFVAGPLPCRQAFDPTSVVDKMTLGEIFLRLLLLPCKHRATTAPYSCFIRLPPKPNHLSNWQHRQITQYSLLGAIYSEIP